MSKRQQGIRTSVILPDETKSRMDLVAFSLNITSSEYIRRAVQMMLNSGVIPTEQSEGIRTIAPGGGMRPRAQCR
ncbi:hypothetical protein [Paraburkholderia phosphatilytica]|uniref:hypothetical protein n=1 Tax=Paraburkholderia phosphatilytica TaxID=2282883 RepID=UPI000E518648|nr:hypothetical protein [Paraburkholderia phosphatilytica]